MSQLCDPPLCAAPCRLNDSPVRHPLHCLDTVLCTQQVEAHLSDQPPLCNFRLHPGDIEIFTSQPINLVTSVHRPIPIIGGKHRSTATSTNTSASHLTSVGAAAAAPPPPGPLLPPPYVLHPVLRLEHCQSQRMLIFVFKHRILSTTCGYRPLFALIRIQDQHYRWMEPTVTVCTVFYEIKSARDHDC